MAASSAAGVAGNGDGMTESYYRVLVHAEDAERALHLRERLVMVQPSARVEIVDAATLAEGDLPEAEVGVIDVTRASRAGIDSLRTLRARGFVAPVVLVAEDPHDDALGNAMKVLGRATCVARSAVVAEPLRLAEELASSARAADDSPAMRELTHTRRVIAAGELALRLQHDINNPLAGLLAEVQLLQLEELTPDQRSATERILALCRRIVGLVRRLDALAESRGMKQMEV